MVPENGTVKPGRQGFQNSVTNHSPDDSYKLFAAQVLLKRLQALSKEIEGVRKAEDIEFIHRMRVATRRIRAALALFEGCFPKKDVINWNRQVKRITRSLGAARDLDVQIDFLEKYLADQTDASHRLGVERLLLRLRQQREKLQPDVVEALERLEKSSVIAEMDETFRQQVVHARLHGISDHSPFVYLEAYRNIMLRLEQMLAYDVYVYQPECITQHHSMRIAAKKLRYVIEVYEPLYNGAMKEPLAHVKEIQELLGELHDTDVWLEYLPFFEEQELKRTHEFYGTPRPFSRLAPALKHLTHNRREHRNRVYKQFAAFWTQLEDSRVWEQLRLALQQRADHAQNHLAEAVPQPDTLAQPEEPESQPLSG